MIKKEDLFLIELSYRKKFTEKRSDQFTTELVDALVKKTRYHRGFPYAFRNGSEYVTCDRTNILFRLRKVRSYRL